MSQQRTPNPKGLLEGSVLSDAPDSIRTGPKISFSAFSRGPYTPRGYVASARARSVTTATRKRSGSRRGSLLSHMRVAVRDDADDDSAPLPSAKEDSLNLYSSSPFRGASPSIVSMNRPGSVPNEVLPQAPDIQHIEGELWYVTGKSIPGKKKRATAQWVVCEDNHLSVYTSWAKSSRQLEERQFEWVRILFDYMHPHNHVGEMSGPVPQTRRMTMLRHQPRTTTESRLVFETRDPLRAKSLAGYYYFGIECVFRDAATGKLRRFLEIFCTDSAADHRQWIDFWEEMQLRYPMVRNRDANAASMDMGSEWLHDFMFPRNPAKSPQPDDADMSSSHLPSPFHNSSCVSPRVPRLGTAANVSSGLLDMTGSALSPVRSGLASGEGSSPLALVPMASTQRCAVRRNLFEEGSAEEGGKGGFPELLRYLAEAERKVREGVECAEMATRSMLEANLALRSLARQALAEEQLPPMACLALLGQSKQDEADALRGAFTQDRAVIHALQSDLKALCAALAQRPPPQPEGACDAALATAASAVPAAPTNDGTPSNAAVASSVTLAEYERQLADLRVQNAKLQEELDGFTSSAAEKVSAAFSAWTELDSLERSALQTAAAPSEKEETLKTQYLQADDALVRALVNAALEREIVSDSVNTSGADNFEGSAPHSSPSAPSSGSRSLSPLEAGLDGGRHGCDENARRDEYAAGHTANAADAPDVLPQVREVVQGRAPLLVSRSLNDAAPRTTVQALIRQQLRHFSLEHPRRLGARLRSAHSNTSAMGASLLTASATAVPLPAASVDVGRASPRDDFLQRVVENIVGAFGTSSAASPRAPQSLAVASSSQGVAGAGVPPLVSSTENSRNEPAEGGATTSTRAGCAVVSLWVLALRRCVEHHREQPGESVGDTGLTAAGSLLSARADGETLAKTPSAGSNQDTTLPIFARDPSCVQRSGPGHRATSSEEALLNEAGRRGRDVVRWLSSLEMHPSGVKSYVEGLAGERSDN
ncbi:hypothetical protein ABB37_00324, partial [Leptomonas pyrrhocoris]